MEEHGIYRTQVLVVGGGLAGLTAAAWLSRHGKRVTLIEKAPKLGGRAITIPIKGFNFNFGAHAIYGRDRSVLRKLEQEIGLQVQWRDFSADKAYYDLGDTTTPLPATLSGILRTEMLDSQNKLRFLYEIFRTLTTLERGEQGVPIGEYLRKEPEQVRDMLLTLSCSNFFTNEPERIPSPLFFQYYRRIFSTQKPVAYIGGGWQSIVNGLEQIVLAHGGEIITKERIQKVLWEEGRIGGLVGRERQYQAEDYLFCVPPKELVNLFAGLRVEELFAEYARYRPTQVVVYDVGLRQRIPSPYTYIFHKKERVFITDISYYDPTCVPEGGQLMQAVSYLNEEEARGDSEEKLALIEAVYDKHFPGWREQLETKRVSKKATVQEIKCVDDQRLMPIKMYSIPNAWFAGDWCEGEGQLSELSFSSAYEVCSRIIKGNKYIL